MLVSRLLLWEGVAFFLSKYCARLAVFRFVHGVYYISPFRKIDFFCCFAQKSFLSSGFPMFGVFLRISRLFFVLPASTTISRTAWRRESFLKKMCTPPRSRLAPTTSSPTSLVRTCGDIYQYDIFGLITSRWYRCGKHVPNGEFGVGYLPKYSGGIFSVTALQNFLP